jgi:hypothetical protein
MSGPVPSTKGDEVSAAELEELDEVKALIVRGLKLGVLTYSEIATATAELDLEETDAEELLGLLRPTACNCFSGTSER